MNIKKPNKQTAEFTKLLQDIEKALDWQTNGKFVEQEAVPYIQSTLLKLTDFGFKLSHTRGEQSKSGIRHKKSQMTRLLALDLSTKTGYAIFDADKLVEYDVVQNNRTVHEYGSYPYSYMAAAVEVAINVQLIVKLHRPDVVVIEETNGSKSRYTQKILEFIHLAVLRELQELRMLGNVVYINTSDWRKAVGGHLSKEDKKLNAKVSKAKKRAKVDGKLDIKLFNKYKKELGVKGRTNKKHVAIRVANTLFGLNLKPKDNDKADAICLGYSYILGVPACDGKQ